MGYYWHIVCEVRVVAKCPTMHRADKENLVSPNGDSAMVLSCCYT